MSENKNKEYVTRSDELGNVHISEEVLAAIAAAAALEVEGIGGLAANLGSDIAELLGKKNLAKGVRVKMEEEKVEVELSVKVLGMTETETVELVVVKIGRSWYIDIESMGDLL